MSHKKLNVRWPWTRTLEYHPHVHCLIPGGGVGADGRWITSRKAFFLPVRALSRLFRGVFMQEAKRALPAQTWPKSIWKQEWVVYAKSTLQRPERVLEYLGRYVHRIAIANSRILSIDEDRVTFRYRRVRDRDVRTMTLSANEFIRRFLQHVLPDGFHKVRYYGRWAPANRQRLQELRKELSEEANPNPDSGDQTKDDCDNLRGSEPPPCPHCEQGRLYWKERIPPAARAPPVS